MHVGSLTLVEQQVFDSLPVA